MEDFELHKHKYLPFVDYQASITMFEEMIIFNFNCKIKVYTNVELINSLGNYQLDSFLKKSLIHDLYETF